MDKYQKAVLQNIFIAGAEGCDGSKPFSNDLRTIIRNGEPIKIVQNKDFSKTYYTVYIYGDQIEKCEVISELFTKVVVQRENLDNTHEGTIEGFGYRYIFDFDKRINKIILYIKNDLCDPIIIPIEYLVADRNQYEKKIKEDHKQMLLDKASILYAFGNDLVNIYFQPCDKFYKRTEIILFRNISGNVKEEKWQFLTDYKIEENLFYHSITGLAYGKYAFILKQFNKNESLLLETEKITFKIEKPKNDFINKKVAPSHIDKRIRPGF